MKRLMLFLACFWVCATPLWAQAQPSTLPPDSMAEVVGYWKTLDYFESRGTLSASQIQTERDQLVVDAERLTGEKTTPDTIANWTARQRLFSLTDWIKTIAVVLLTVGGIALFIATIIPALRRIPPVAWEVSGYCVAGSLMFLVPNVWAALGGAILLPVVLSYSIWASKQFNTDRSYDTWGMWISSICLVAWTIAAFRQQSPMLGFLAVGALESLLGFTIIVTPLCYGFGFTRKQYIPRGTFSSLLLIALGIFLQKVAPAPFALFTASLIGIGSFVYFIGLLILSSKYYNQSRSFWPLQALAVLSGFAALYLGPLLDAPFLQSVGGTLFVFYLVEKYIEIEWGKLRYSVGAIGLGALLYGLATVIRLYPQYFLFRFH